jgi:TnsA endonuclease N terminal
MRLVSEVRLMPRNPHRKLPQSSAVRGILTVPFSNAPVQFQSEMERNFVVICRNSVEVMGLVREPFSVSFHDHAANQRRIYTPDYLVRYRSREGGTRQTLVEVKTDADFWRTIETNRPSYIAAQIWAETQPDTRFEIATDRWMKEIGLANILLLDAIRNREFDNDQLTMFRDFFLNGKSLTPLAAKAAAKSALLGADLAMPALLKLVTLGELAFDLSEALQEDTQFYVGKIKRTFR